MTMLDLAETLKQHFNADRAADFDLGVEFDCASKTYRVDIRHGVATFYSSAQQAPAPELVLYFPDEQSVADLLAGHRKPLDAFMQGDFRSNGYLFWAFQTLAIFAVD